MPWMYDLSICIVNWNTVDLLRNCLDSIFKQKWKTSIEVIVVDNDSSDSSLEMMVCEFPQVKIIANKENVGFARANNQAIAQSNGKYILLLNSDTVVFPESLDVVVDFIDRHPEAGMVGCKLINPDGSLQRSCWQGFPSLKSTIIDSFYLWRLFPGSTWVSRSELPVEQLDCELEVDHLLGAFMLVRREVIDSVGGMDESIFLFLEETEWCYRIKNNGWHIFYLPTAKVLHLGQQSVHKNPERTLPELYRNQVWFYRKSEKPTRMREFLLKLVIAVAAVIRFNLWVWRSLSVVQRAKAFRMQRGYLEVLRQLHSF
jgi:GT2 family glycosyltransferase